MCQIKELSMLVDELKKCGETLVSISESVADLFSSSNEKKSEKKTASKKNSEPKPEQFVKEEKKVVTLEEVRMVLAEKSRAGFTDEVKAIITKHGAEKLSDITPTEFESVLAEAEVIGSA